MFGAGPSSLEPGLEDLFGECQQCLSLDDLSLVLSWPPVLWTLGGGGKQRMAGSQGDRSHS